MARLTDELIVERKGSKKSWQSWYLVKWLTHNSVGVSVGKVQFPKTMLGKRVQLKFCELESPQSLEDKK
jgi:hypothetical protein